VPTHPYPLYELVAEGVLLLGIWLARDRLKGPGQQFMAATLGYSVIRFTLTFFRQETVILWGLQEAQVLAIATGLVAAAAYGLYSLRTASRSIPPPVAA